MIINMVNCFQVIYIFPFHCTDSDQSQGLFYCFRNQSENNKQNDGIQCLVLVNIARGGGGGGWCSGKNGPQQIGAEMKIWIS